MSPGELREALETLGISQLEFARRLDVYGQTVRRWVRQGGEVPGPVAVLAHLLLMRPELCDVIGIETGGNRSGRRTK